MDTTTAVLGDIDVIHGWTTEKSSIQFHTSAC